MWFNFPKIKILTLLFMHQSSNMEKSKIKNKANRNLFTIKNFQRNWCQNLNWMVSEKHSSIISFQNSLTLLFLIVLLLRLGHVHLTINFLLDILICCESAHNKCFNFLTRISALSSSQLSESNLVPITLTPAISPVVGSNLLKVLHFIQDSGLIEEHSEVDVFMESGKVKIQSIKKGK